MTKEMEEPFESDQIGSSAMTYKVCAVHKMLLFFPGGQQLRSREREIGVVFPTFRSLATIIASSIVNKKRQRSFSLTFPTPWVLNSALLLFSIYYLLYRLDSYLLRGKHFLMA